MADDQGNVGNAFPALTRELSYEANDAYSGDEPRPFPSAILAGIESAEQL